MALHVLSHPWEVRQVEDGIRVQLNRQDLNVHSISVLAEELFDLALESSGPVLYLDFAEVDCLPSLVVGKLYALDRRLREVGGRLVLCNPRPAVKELLQAESWPEPVQPA
jgi:anti-anti-sigma factor